MESDHQEQDLTDAKLQNEIHRNEIVNTVSSIIFANDARGFL